MDFLKIKNSYLIYLFLLIAFSACDKDDDSDDGNTVPGINESSQIIKSHDWIISFFEDDGKDESHHFTGYVFSFNNDRTVTATDQSNTVNGTWNIRISSNEQLKLDLNFGINDPWDELQDDWDIISLINSEIKLKDVSGGDGSIDYLTFVKN